MVHRPVAEGVDVARADDGSWTVLGRAAGRAVALSDLTDDDAMAEVQARLRRLGVERALVRAGVREGDIVHLGPLTFEYHRDDGSLGVGGDDAPVDSRPRRRRGSRPA